MAQPSDEIRAKLQQQQLDFMKLALLAQQQKQAVLNAEKIAGQPPRLPTDKMSKGGLEKFLEPSKEKRPMYHATHNNFSAFRNNPRGMHFVTPNPEFAEDFLTNSGQNEYEEGANIMPVHVHAKNPFDYENKEHRHHLAVKAGLSPQGRENIKSGAWHHLEDRGIMHAIKSLGHDSMYVNEGGEKNLGVFSPNQIKSAIGNRGTYDINEHDITKADGGLIHMSKGGQEEDDYRGSHTAPGPHFGAPMHDVTRDMYPKDFYGPNGFRYYADFGEHHDREAYDKVRRVKGKPEEMVAIHRAIPTSVYKAALKKDMPLKHMIRKGDWVAIAKQYAKEHGESVLNGDYKIASMRVPAKHVWTNGDSVHEWGYHPDEPIKSKAHGGRVTHAHHLEIEERPL